MAEKLDSFPNIITGTLTMSGANTITFSEINVGFTLFDKAALLVQRLEVVPSLASMQDLDHDGDELHWGLTQSNALTTLLTNQSEVIDEFGCRVDILGAVVSKEFYQIPFIHDFSTLKGGGILVAPRPLYAAGHSGGMTVAAVFYWRIYFTIIQLSSDQYLELLETRRAFG